MSPKQENFYWSLWGKVKTSLLRRGRNPKEAEAERHALHVKALGADKSHRTFTNAEFDKVIAVFKAEFDDANLTAQITQQTMPRERLLHLIDDLLLVLGKERNYAQGIVRRMNAEHDLGPAELQLEEISEEQLQTKLIPALKKACRRLWRTKDDLVAALHDWSTDADLDEATAQKAVCEALHLSRMKPLDKLSYDQLLTTWATLRRLPLAEPVQAGPTRRIRCDVCEDVHEEGASCAKCSAAQSDEDGPRFICRDCCTCHLTTLPSAASRTPAESPEETAGTPF